MSVSLSRAFPLGPGRAGCALVTLMCLLALGCGDPGRPSRDYRGGGFSLNYPADWQITHDQIDIELAGARMLGLRSPSDAVLLVSSFAPSSGVSLEAFSQRYTELREDALRAADPPLRASPPRAFPIEAVIFGQRRQGIGQDFEVARADAQHAHRTAFFKVERSGRELFVVADASRRAWPSAHLEFERMLRSLDALPGVRVAELTDRAPAPAEP